MKTIIRWRNVCKNLGLILFEAILFRFIPLPPEPLAIVAFVVGFSTTCFSLHYWEIVDFE